MMIKTHSKEFKELALLKARGRGLRTIAEVARELNMSTGTLRGWLRSSRKLALGAHAPLRPADGLVQTWDASRRLDALNASHSLSGEALSAWCRERGLFEHQLTQWREDFCKPVALASREDTLAFRDLQRSHEQLQRELRRKDRALAETAALLVLQKKFHALLEEEDK